MSLLEVSNLRKTYTDSAGLEALVLEIPSFKLGKSEQVSIYGKSGSGKTTFLNCIAGIQSPDSGEILIDGESMAPAPEKRRDQIRGEKLGFVFQGLHLLDGISILQNVELAFAFSKKKAKRDRAKELLVSLGLEKYLESFPAQLSVGQKQRVALARALAPEPVLVLADEPTGNLDSESKFQAMKTIQESCQTSEASLVLVSHDSEVLAMFDRSIDLEELRGSL